MAHLSELTLLKILGEATAAVPPGSEWRHNTAGSTYFILSVTLCEGNHAPLISYRRRDSALPWTRPLAEFVERFRPVTPERRRGTPCARGATV